MPPQRDPNLLVGTETSDDAGVYRLSDELALVQTIDFFTPIVSDPYLFGEIAAANALSDVYAMGGRPLTAMNLLTFSPRTLPVADAGAILRGGAAKVAEAGAVIVGGHTIEDDQVKYGLAVTGLVHPQRVLANAGAKPGDGLVLTKAIGTGIITTALTAGAAAADSEDAAIASMRTLNRRAAEAAAEHAVNGCTDITGFGLLGHLVELAEGSRVAVTLAARAVPLLPAALALAADGWLPAGLYRNRDHFGGRVDFARGVAEPLQDALYDPQTSGGLLLSLPLAAARTLAATLRNAGHPAALIGVVAAGSPRINITAEPSVD